ncbi:Tn7-like element transposition protein TnsE [uncultured Clostridium sp.]|uniref:Tn7-like element transposition protein TnsE n=1 Tax=uncultured Clostridium sp. TaxID=59620 RepID=UPI0025FC292B|nr:Tn7-like element transposition protein TnsE [uncultured Clostridium sp.]
MGRMQLKIKNWPFEKGKKAQLIWIGEPFKFNNKWMIDTYFNDEKVTKRIVQDWANIHFLSIDKYYTDGDLNSGEVIDKDGVIETIDIDLSNVVPKYNENDWRIKGSSYKSKSRTFNFYKNNKLYSIPVVEIVRSVLAPNTFMLNTILYSDTFEDYFTYEINNRILNLYFNSNYRTTNLKDVYYNHFAWIIGNKDILNMVSAIGYNTSIKHKMMFDFNIHNFKFTARVRKTKYGYLVQEIIKVREKRISFNEIRVFHPSFEKYERSNEAKKWSYANLSNSINKERTIDNETDGSTKGAESIKDELVVQEYLNIPKIKKEKIGHVNKREIEDENTKKFVREDDDRRTFVDKGGFNKTRGIEVSDVDVRSVSGELKEFIEILNRLKVMKGIKNIHIRVVNLPLGRRFSFTNQKMIRRQCVLAQITDYMENKYGVIEVERNGKSLSTLILYNIKLYCWENIYSLILKSLVYEGGKWDNDILELLKKKNVLVKRHRHSNKEILKRASNIYREIIGYNLM